jgi:acyl-CoA synthetase (AMP-forming)/AMP-acid ligase II
LSFASRPGILWEETYLHTNPVRLVDRHCSVPVRYLAYMWSIPASTKDGREMESSRFDELTKALATSTSRRQALKTIAATTLGSILGLSGLGTALTTERAKAVMLTHANMVTTGVATARGLHLQPENIVQTAAPVAASGGFHLCLMGTFSRGGTIVIEPFFDAETTWARRRVVDAGTGSDARVLQRPAGDG